MTAPDIRICFLGDSYTQGTGDDECLGWVGRVCASARHAGHNITAYNLGVRRETSTDIAGRWRAECGPRLLPATENHVVFSFGANDASIVDGQRRVAEDDTLANLRTLLDDARSRYRTLVIGPPAVPDEAQNARLVQLSKRMHEVAHRCDVPYLELFPQTVTDAGWLSEVRDNDGAHPRAAGYAKIARLIEAWPAWWFRRG